MDQCGRLHLVCLPANTNSETGTETNTDTNTKTNRGTNTERRAEQQLERQGGRKDGSVWLFAPCFYKTFASPLFFSPYAAL